MKVSVSITDRRQKRNAFTGLANAGSEMEDYERVNVVEAKGTKRVIAGLLRSIADDIDPQDTPAQMGVSA